MFVLVVFLACSTYIQIRSFVCIYIIFIFFLEKTKIDIRFFMFIGPCTIVIVEE